MSDENEIENDTLLWASNIDPEMALTPTVSAEKAPTNNIDRLENYDLDDYREDDDLDMEI